MSLRSRRGVGVVLPIVIGLLVILLMGALLQLFSTGSSLRQAARDAGGAVAEQLALSAIEEGLWHFQTLVNDPDGPLFEPLRKLVIQGDQARFDLTDLCRPVLLGKRLETSPHRGFYRHLRIESFGMVLRVPTRPGAPVEPEDVVAPGEQYVDVDCAVSLDLQETTIWRRVCRRRHWGITHIAPYKPFDQLTFAIVRSDFLGRYPGVLTEMTALIDNVNRAAGFLSSLRSLLAAGVPEITLSPGFVPVGEAPAMPSEVRAAADEIMAVRRESDPSFDAQFAAMDPEAQGWFRWSLVLGRPEGMIDRLAPDPPPDFAPRWPMISRSALLTDIPSADSVVFSVEPRVKLADYDYDRQVLEGLEPPLDALKRAAESYNEGVAALLGDAGSTLGVGELRRLESLAESSGRIIGEKLRLAIDVLNAVSMHLNAHTRAGFTSEVLRAYVNQSSRRLRNLAWHAEVPADVEALRTRLPVFNGHVNYNGLAALTLNLDQWRGKTIFSAPYREDTKVPVTVERVTRGSPDRDLVVLNYDDLYLRGERIEAAVHAADRLHLVGEPEIVGNLVINRLRLRQDRKSDEDLRGTVTYDPRVWSGAYLKRLTLPDDREQPLDVTKISLGHYTVALCPRSMETAIFRSRDAQGQPDDEEEP